MFSWPQAASLALLSEIMRAFSAIFLQTGATPANSDGCNHDKMASHGHSSSSMLCLDAFILRNVRFSFVPLFWCCFQRTTVLNEIGIGMLKARSHFLTCTGAWAVNEFRVYCKHGETAKQKVYGKEEVWILGIVKKIAVQVMNILSNFWFNQNFYICLCILSSF